ncbi:unnamed protein product, partial [Didymodactylos carnosus]
YRINMSVVKAWSNSDVLAFLDEHGLSSFASKFIDKTKVKRNFSGFRTHIRQIHSCSPVFQLKCPKCEDGKILVSHEAWRKHLQRKHGPEQPETSLNKFSRLFQSSEDAHDNFLCSENAVSFEDNPSQNSDTEVQQSYPVEDLNKLYLHLLLQLRGEAMLSARTTQLVSSSLENVVESIVESVLQTCAISRDSPEIQHLLGSIMIALVEYV